MSLKHGPKVTDGEQAPSRVSNFAARIPILNRIKEVFLPVPEREVELISDEFKLQEFSTFGVPGVATCISYNPVQKLLALGTSVGKVVVLGREEISLRFNVELDQLIKHLYFHSNLPLIAVITENNHLYVIDIENETVNLAFKALDQITCVEPYTNSNWLLLGTDLGKILLLDLVYGYPSKYEIESIPSKINFMKLHPSNDDQILLGASNEKIYLISFKERKAILEFDLRSIAALEAPIAITSLCWKPEGETFAVGYNNGWIAFWDIADNTQPILIRTATLEVIDIALELAVPEPREPISSLTWCQHSDTQETTLFLTGGEEEGQEPRLTIIKLAKELSPPVSELSAELTFKAVKCLHALPSSYPWGTGTLDPFAILILSTEGTLLSYNVDGDVLALPGHLEWLGSDRIHTQLITNCPSNIFHSLLANEHGLHSSKGKTQLSFQGGAAQPHQQDTGVHDLVLTSHGDGTIQLWDVSSIEISRLKHVTTLPSYNLTPDALLGFSKEVEGICVGYSDNTIRLFRFTREPGDQGRSQAPAENKPEFFIIEYEAGPLVFELFGHRDGLAALESKYGLLATSDKAGRFTITSLKDRRIVFSETGDKPAEHFVKLHFSSCDDNVRILGVTNLANGYLYLLSSDKVIAKEKIFSTLFQDEIVICLTLYSYMPEESPQVKSTEKKSFFKTALNKLSEGTLKADLSVFEPLPRDYFDPKDHIVICLSGKIIIFSLYNRRVSKILEIRPDRGNILKATFVSLKDLIVCIKTTGFVDIYRLPGLQVLYRSDVYFTFNADQFSITDDGRIAVNVNKNELSLLYLTKDHSALSRNPKLFDPSKKAPEGSSSDSPWYALPFSKARSEGPKKLFDKNRPENLAPIDRTKSNSHVNLKTFTSAADYIPPNSPVANYGPAGVSDNSGSSALAAAMNRNKELLREREEKLSHIGDKTQAAADSAQDFLKEIRAYNQKQAKKKWYQL